MSHTLWDIPGGIQVEPDHKAESTQTPIRVCPLPSRLIIPLQQHIGPAAEVCVRVGERVLKGQKIADSDARTFAPIHASSSGVIVEIGLYPTDSQEQPIQSCIVIETDGKEEWITHEDVPDYRSLSPHTLISHIRAAGIAGLGGAGFPTASKLASGAQTKIDTIVVNGMECEPYITCDDMLMRERAEEIIEGARIVQYILGAEKILIGIEDNKPFAADSMKRAAEPYTDIKVRVAPTLYPSGAARQTVKILTGRETPADGYTIDVGVFCFNAGTAAAVYRAICHGEPLLSRITTVTGMGVSLPGNFDVRIGTPVDFLLAQAGARFNDITRIIVGGPMMGYTLEDITAPVSKMSNCIIAGTAKDFPPPPPELPCIRCGNCAVVCPVTLLPQQLYFFARGNDFAKAQHYNLSDCIECGACSYVCPSTIPLVQYFRYAKNAIAQKKQEEDQAQRARERFEARLARLNKEEAEKEIRKRERTQPKPVQAETSGSAQNSGVSSDTVNRPTKPSVDPIFALQTAFNAANKKLKAAEAALATAVSSGASNQEDMQQKVDTLR
ncbi:MAG TPA: electron transport complex subunit RsxC, partial [Pseudomonadales bacterium]|nr:electron transport complex subunit RsxC [Pseudomonadales bacterium]